MAHLSMDELKSSYVGKTVWYRTGTKDVNKGIFMSEYADDKQYAEIMPDEPVSGADPDCPIIIKPECIYAAKEDLLRAKKERPVAIDVKKIGTLVWYRTDSDGLRSGILKYVKGGMGHIEAKTCHGRPIGYYIVNDVPLGEIYVSKEDLMAENRDLFDNGRGDEGTIASDREKYAARIRTVKDLIQMYNSYKAMELALGDCVGMLCGQKGGVDEKIQKLIDDLKSEVTERPEDEWESGYNSGLNKGIRALESLAEGEQGWLNQ